MSAVARIGTVVLGPGRPAVCVPLTGASVEALAVEAEAIPRSVADLVELRIDRFADVGDAAAVEQAITAVRSALDPALPILFTCRTAREGGGANLPPGVFADVVGVAAQHPGVAAVDLEMDLPDGLAARLAAVVHARGLPVVLSFHDLSGTPSRGHIVDRLVRQHELGADVVKLACTPRSPEDVLTLLGATSDYAALPGSRPAITVAMGPRGVVSRIAGEAFGSVLTFGTVGAASAPGQVDARALRAALDLVHGAQPA